MDGSFCNQVLAQIYLFKNGFGSKRFNKKNIFLKKLPKKIDEEVASLMVKGFGGVLTKLTNKQANYIDVDAEGPYKSEDYSY